MNKTLLIGFMTCMSMSFWAGCSPVEEPREAPEEFSKKTAELVTCTINDVESVVLGYEKLVPLVQYGQHLLEPETANAFYAMQQQAKEEGVTLHILKGFIEHSKLTELFDCGPEGTCDCNFCNDVPYPGYSKHQAGTSVDLQMDLPGTHDWLDENAAAYGFVQEDPGHPWHWIYEGMASFPGPCNGVANEPATGLAPHSANSFWTLTRDGLITAYGQPQYYGQPSPPEFPLYWRAMTSAADNGGYWVISNQGQVQGFGDASAFTENHIITFESGDVAGIIGSKTGLGYWVATEDGSVQAYGDAPELPKTVVTSSNMPVSAMVPVLEGGGFWLLREDGSLVMHNAPFYGELNLDDDIAISLAPTASGEGYWILGETGKIYPFGDAQDMGTLLGLTDSPVVSILGSQNEQQGLWVLEENGSVTALEGATSLPVGTLGYDVTGIAPTPLELLYSLSSDRSNPTPLDGASISQDVYVFISPTGEVSRARFAANVDPVNGPLLGEDSTWPFDLAGGTLVNANALDTYDLPNGQNTIYVHVERLHGLESSQIGATFFVDNPTCGDGKVEGIEQCDSGPCCDPEKCQLLPAGTECRPVSGNCDILEVCSGSSPLCPEDIWKPASTVCRPKGTECDIEELCPGNGPDCPNNAVLPEGTPCENDGTCELGFCITPEVEEPDVIEPVEDVADSPDSMEEEDALEPEETDEEDVPDAAMEQEADTVIAAEDTQDLSPGDTNSTMDSEVSSALDGDISEEQTNEADALSPDASSQSKADTSAPSIAQPSPDTQMGEAAENAAVDASPDSTQSVLEAESGSDDGCRHHSTSLPAIVLLSLLWILSRYRETPPVPRRSRSTP